MRCFEEEKKEKEESQGKKREKGKKKNLPRMTPKRKNLPKRDDAEKEEPAKDDAENEEPAKDDAEKEEESCHKGGRRHKEKDIEKKDKVATRSPKLRGGKTQAEQGNDASGRLPRQEATPAAKKKSKCIDSTVEKF